MRGPTHNYQKSKGAPLETSVMPQEDSTAKSVLHIPTYYIRVSVQVTQYIESVLTGLFFLLTPGNKKEVANRGSSQGPHLTAIP